MTFEVSLAVFVLHFVCVGILAVFGLHRLLLVFRYYKFRNAPPRPKSFYRTLPRVTVQLPIYNEREVADRLIRSVAALSYPRDRLEIQVLDDSTDETKTIVHNLVEHYIRTGLDIKHVRRPDRRGYKAGALAEGLKDASGELIAVFDADFVPPADFLERTVHFFTDEKCSMVQLRWGHLNTPYSLLTRAQTILLDGHFQIEHTARNRCGFFFNFNGTAGIWRKKAIAEAGDWEGDTLTEDLDLSYRAQLQGAGFVYLLEHTVPAELPIALDAFKSQQHRWTKGSIQVLQKLSSRILRAPLSWRVKFEAFVHLAANFCYPLLLLVGLLILPAVEARSHLGETALALSVLYKTVFLSAFFSIILFYSAAAREARGVSWGRALLEAPLGLIVGIGLSLSNSLAVFEALLGKKSEFNRTPKTGTALQNSKSERRIQRHIWRSWLTGFELMLCSYFAVSCVRAAALECYETLPFLCLFFLSFAYFFYLGICQFFGRWTPGLTVPFDSPLWARS